MLRRHQGLVNQARRAFVTWKEKNDLESLRDCAYTWMIAARPFDKYRVEFLKEAKDKFELLLDRDSNDQCARYKLGMACKGLLAETKYGEDYVKLCWQAIDCFKRVQNESSKTALRSMVHYLPPDSPQKQLLEKELMAQPLQPLQWLEMLKTLYQREIKVAHKAKEAWNQDNDDIKNLMICTSALLRAAQHAVPDSSRLECLQDAKKMLEEFLKRDCDNHYAKFNLGTACFRLWKEESVTGKDELCLKAINYFKEAQTKLPAESEKMLSCISELLPPDQRLFYKLPNCKKADAPLFDFQSRSIDDVYRESFEYLENPHILMRRFEERQDRKEVSTEDLLKKFEAGLSKIKDNEERSRYLKAYLETEEALKSSDRAILPKDEDKSPVQLSDLEPTYSPMFDIKRSAFYGHIEALKDAERESVEDPENPQILKRLGTAFMEIARSVEDQNEKMMFFAGAMKKFDAIYSKTNDKEARYDYLKASLEISPRKGDEDVHYDQLLEECHFELEGAIKMSTSSDRVIMPIDEDKLSDLEPTYSSVSDSALYGHIQALKDAERESVEDPENPLILKRWGNALMEIARYIEDEEEKMMFFAGAMDKFDAVYFKTNDKEARHGYLKAYLERSSSSSSDEEGCEDVHYNQLLKEYYELLGGCRAGKDDGNESSFPF